MGAYVSGDRGPDEFHGGYGFKVRLIGWDVFAWVDFGWSEFAWGDFDFGDFGWSGGGAMGSINLLCGYFSCIKFLDGSKMFGSGGSI